LSDVHHCGIGDDAQVAAGAGDAGLAQRNDVVIGGNFFFDAPVKIFVLEEDDRIVVANGGLDEAFGIVGGGGADDFQARSVHEVHFGILRMKRAAMHVAAAGTADHERSGRAPSVVGFGDHVGDLVEGTADEVHELEFGDGAQAGESCAEGCTDDRGFGDGGIDDPLGAEAVDEAVGDLEGAAVDADVLADTKDGGVALHFFPDSLADGFEIGESRHRLLASSS